MTVTTTVAAYRVVTAQEFNHVLGAKRAMLHALARIVDIAEVAAARQMPDD